MARMRKRETWLMALTALALAACGGEAPPAPAPSPAAIATATVTPIPTETATVAPSPTPEATPAATPTPLTLAECKRILALGDRFGEKPPDGGPCLIVVSDGTADALMLEWAGGSANATKWQYRLAIWTPENHPNPPWGEWGDIPNSGAAMRAYRLTGLTKASQYRVQIRASVGAVSQTPSNTFSGSTHPAPPQLPSFHVLTIVEGDGTQEWRIQGRQEVIVVPKGMRVRLGRWGLGDGATYAPLYDVVSGSAIGLKSTYDSSGNLVTSFTNERDIITPSPGSEALLRDVNALFDKIVASIRTVIIPTPTPTPTPTPAPTPTCTQTTLGVDPTTNTGLAGDCNTLLAIKATLAGTGSLNWSASTVLTSWDGVTVSGTPQRVTGLSLASHGLTGTIPPRLGNLTQLTTLRLSSNSLTGWVPSELGNLTGLTSLYLGKNTLRGCIPSALKSVKNSDIATLPIIYCQNPVDVSQGPYVLKEGTYQFVLNSRSRPFIFDVPPGITIELTAVSSGTEGGGYMIYMEEVTTRVEICFSLFSALECGRSGESAISENSALPGLIDRISRSARVGEKP